MIVKNIQVTDLNSSIQLARALAYIPGADTTITLEAKESKLHMLANTAGISIKNAIPATIEKPGYILVDMNHLSSIYLKDKELSLSADKEEIKIKCGKSSYKLTAIAGDPHIVKIPEPESSTVQIAISTLKKAIESIWFRQEEGSGDLRLIIGNGKLIAETSDNYSGAIWQMPMKGLKNKPFRITIKKQTMSVLIDSFNSTDIVWIDVENNKPSQNLRLYTSNSLISVPIANESTLTDTHGILKSRLSQLKLKCSFQVDSKEICEAAKSASSVIEEIARTKSVQTYLTIKKDKTLEISTEGDVGSFSTTIGLLEYKPNDNKDIHKICVLSKHLKDLVGLAAKTGKAIDVEIWGKGIILLKTTETNSEFKATYAFPLI